MAKKKAEEPGFTPAEVKDLDEFWKRRSGGGKKKAAPKAAPKPGKKK